MAAAPCRSLKSKGRFCRAQQSEGRAAARDVSSSLCMGNCGAGARPPRHPPASDGSRAETPRRPGALLALLALLARSNTTALGKWVLLGQQLAGTDCPAAGKPTDHFAQITPKTPCSPFALRVAGNGKSSGFKNYRKIQTCTPMTQSKQCRCTAPRASRREIRKTNAAGIINS